MTVGYVTQQIFKWESKLNLMNPTGAEIGMVPRGEIVVIAADGLAPISKQI